MVTAWSLTINPYHLLFLAGPLDRIQCPLRVDIRKSLFVSHHWYVHM